MTEDETNIVLTERKLPNSPSQFPSSVKDKIKDISNRLKHEIQKKEQPKHQKRKSNVNDITQTSVAKSRE
mgnify:CR=1 FL=1